MNNRIEAIDFTQNKTYYPTTKESGKIVISKIDRIKKIISGTFSFKGVNENNSNDVITVTDGRFDVTYN